MRRREGRTGAVRPQLRSHQALGASPEPDENGLAWTQLRKTKAPQCFHMHEDVLRAVTASYEPEPLEAVEPLHHGTLPIAFCDDGDMGALR